VVVGGGGRREPMLPLELFRVRQFNAANLVTFIVYAALVGATFVVPVGLQQVAGYAPLQAGAALVPVTILMLALSARAGQLAQRIGPRLPMSLGPIIAGAGLALLVRLDAGTTYLTTVLPAIVVFGLGLSLTVAPLTSTVLSAVSDEHAGGAAAPNNHAAPGARPVSVSAPPLASGL